MIYTSYFASRKYKKEDGVSIARYVDFWIGGSYPDLAPSPTLLAWWKGLPKDLQYDNYYQQLYFTYYKQETLDKLDPHKVATDLDGKVLLCYEKASDFCHRHIVAAWLRHHGYECEEIDYIKDTEN
jgi:uncharacterized protein YeaO (DUF488 family)